MDLPALGPLPDGFAATVEGLHRVAERIVAPARKPDNEISLRATPGGFGTPVFEFEGVEHQVRVEGAELVHSMDGGERRAPLDSLATAAAAVSELLPAGVELDDDPLGVEEDSSWALGAFYAFAAAALTELAAEADPVDAPTLPRLWPEHFDVAIELGSETDGVRANYGASPGDEDHGEPYLYVGPWTAEVSGELWNARGFSGAELGYAELLVAADPGRAAIDFLRSRRDALTQKRHTTEESK